MDSMEMHLLFTLFFPFIGISMFLATTEGPAPSSYCNPKNKGSIRIDYNFSENGFSVDVLNLSKGMYEIAVINCKTRHFTCDSHYKLSSKSPPEINLFFNYSCFTCGNQEAISVHLLSKNQITVRQLTKPGCVITQQAFTSTIPSTSKDLVSSIIPSNRKDILSTATPSTSKGFPLSNIPSTSKHLVSTTIPSTSKHLVSTTIPSTSKHLVSTTIPSTNKLAILISISAILFVALLVSGCFICYVYRNKKIKFHLSPNNENSGSSNIQGLVICCPCSEVHREATKEFLSLINNFTDLHAISYLDLWLSQENSIPTLIQQLYNRVGWIVIIESPNFYHHSNEKDLKASPHLCNLMADFSVQLLKHSLKVNKNQKTIYRISFDLTFKEFSLSQIFPKLKGHTYGLLMERMGFSLCLNFDEIEKFFETLTYEQLGVSEKNTRRWAKNNWKESSEAKNLEKALVNRTDEMQNSSGCYFVDEKYFSAKKSLFNSHPATNQLFYWNLGKFHKEEEFEKCSETEKESGSIETFSNNFLFDRLKDNQSLNNRFPCFTNSQSISSDISSDRISLELQQINLETDAKINNNLLKIIEEQMDELEELSV